MLSATKKRSIIATGVILFAAALACIYYCPFSQSGPIVPYQESRDYKDIIELFELERFLLTATPDYSPEFMLKYMSPHKWDPRYKGKLHIDVLRPDNEFVGFTAYYIEQPGEGRILFLAIRPEVRGKGYGKLLIRHAIKKLKELGAGTIKLVTRTINIPAQKTYISVGFDEVLRDNLEGYVYYEYTK